MRGRWVSLSWRYNLPFGHMTYAQSEAGEVCRCGRRRALKRFSANDSEGVLGGGARRPADPSEALGADGQEQPAARQSGQPGERVRTFRRVCFLCHCERSEAISSRLRTCVEIAACFAPRNDGKTESIPLHPIVLARRSPRVARIEAVAPDSAICLQWFAAHGTSAPGSILHDCGGICGRSALARQRDGGFERFDAPHWLAARRWRPQTKAAGCR